MSVFLSFLIFKWHSDTFGVFFRVRRDIAAFEDGPTLDGAVSWTQGTWPPSFNGPKPSSGSQRCGQSKWSKCRMFILLRLFWIYIVNIYCLYLFLFFMFFYDCFSCYIFLNFTCVGCDATLYTVHLVPKWHRYTAAVTLWRCEDLEKLIKTAFRQVSETLKPGIAFPCFLDVIPTQIREIRTMNGTNCCKTTAGLTRWKVEQRGRENTTKIYE